MGKMMFSFVSVISFSAILFMATQTLAAETLRVSSKNSEVAFSGEHAGMTFSGIFEKWEASLSLPPHNNPNIEAEFDLGSAKTGDSTYDSTLPEGDWFDVESHPKGSFKSTKITPKGNDFEVEGNLELRGISQPVVFLLEDKGSSYEAKFGINRLKYNIGMESDPDAEWVSETIEMHMELVK
jgi:polyisoprenoid-binding protein YceI